MFKNLKIKPLKILATTTAITFWQIITIVVVLADLFNILFCGDTALEVLHTQCLFYHNLI